MPKHAIMGYLPPSLPPPFSSRVGRMQAGEVPRLAGHTSLLTPVMYGRPTALRNPRLRTRAGSPDTSALPKPSSAPHAQPSPLGNAGHSHYCSSAQTPRELIFPFL